MKSYRVERMATGVLCVAVVPFLVVLGIDGFGSLAKAAQVSDGTGVWIFSWALDALGCGAALLISWVCFFGARYDPDKQRTNQPLDAS